MRRFVPLIALAVVLVTAPLGQSQDADPLVRVRVEGKTSTVFGAAQPRARAATALEALEVASTAGEFYYHVQETSFGPFVDQIGRYPAEGSSGWVFKVNGASPPVGADKVELKNGDVVLWYWATFSDAGGPPTLDLGRERRVATAWWPGTTPEGCRSLRHVPSTGGECRCRAPGHASASTVAWCVPMRQAQ